MTTELNKPSALVPASKAQPSTRRLTDKLPRQIKLMLTDSPGLFELSTSAPILLGRMAGGQVVDVDLTLFNGQLLGVSRLHATIEAFGERLMLKDAGSVNGTRLNGSLLTPNHVYQIFHGDEIRLGKLNMRVYFVHD
jgi:hypothetical protein